jgi:hypothetical protein
LKLMGREFVNTGEKEITKNCMEGKELKMEKG